MMKGWVPLYRSIMDDPRYFSVPFDKIRAWIDLTMLANHKDGIMTYRGIDVVVKKGQVGWSISKLAERWQWSKGKVKRFFNELALENKIVIEDASKAINVNGTQNIARNRTQTGTQNEISFHNVTSLISIITEGMYEKEERKLERKMERKATYETERNNNTNSNSYIKRNNIVQTKSQKKPPKKSFLRSAISPLEKTKENRHLRMALTIWKLLEPFHGHRHAFKNATFEKWGKDVKTLFNHARNEVEVYDLVQWIVKEKEDTIPYFQSPNYLIKNDGKNYDISLALKEASERKKKEKEVVHGSDHRIKFVTLEDYDRD